LIIPFIYCLKKWNLIWFMILIINIISIHKNIPFDSIIWFLFVLLRILSINTSLTYFILSVSLINLMIVLYVNTTLSVSNDIHILLNKLPFLIWIKWSFLTIQIKETRMIQIRISTWICKIIVLFSHNCLIIKSLHNILFNFIICSLWKLLAMVFIITF